MTDEKLDSFKDRAVRVVNWAFGGSHHTTGFKWDDDWRGCSFGVSLNDMGTYDGAGLTKLVVACHDECVRGQLSDGGPGRIRIRLSHRKRKHTHPDMCAHPTLEQHVEQIRKGGNYQPLFDLLRAEESEVSK